MWTINSASLDALFRKARDSCLLSHIHFHDSRAEALTLLSRRMDVLTLSKISGHRDLRQLLEYYRESAEQIAARI
jgi:integrase